MTKLASFVSCSIVALALGAGCGSKKGSQCEEIFDHTVSLMPAEFKDKAIEGKAKALEKCEKMSPEAKTCALEAKAMEDLMKCPRS